MFPQHARHIPTKADKGRSVDFWADNFYSTAHWYAGAQNFL